METIQQACYMFSANSERNMMARDGFKIRIVNPSGQDILGSFECEANVAVVARKVADFVGENRAKVHLDWVVHISKENGDLWSPSMTVAELDR
jgi:hypothetical protein